MLDAFAIIQSNLLKIWHSLHIVVLVLCMQLMCAKTADIMLQLIVILLLIDLLSAQTLNHKVQGTSLIRITAVAEDGINAEVVFMHINVWYN